MSNNEFDLLNTGLKSRPLTITMIAVVAIAVALQFSPFAAYFGFVRPPLAFFAFLVAAAATYLVLVKLVKRRLMRRLIR
jgi:Mg2+-importing ATPase